MDLDRLDVLARSFASAGSRRSLLGLLAAVPVVGGLLTSRETEDAEAKDRRRRRKQRHKRRKSPGTRKHEKHTKPCKAESVAQSCAGKCGAVTNTCKHAVDCGSCACDPACDDCFTCQDGPNTPGTCVIDPLKQGQACGDPGQVCQSDGRCACDAGSCDSARPVCAGGACVSCSATHPCPTGQCCATDGSCVAVCPTCQICDQGLCIPDAALDHTCDGPCSDGAWCNAGACASIVETVRIPHCQSRCGDGAVVCGLSVTCPGCDRCLEQTGCSSNFLQDGPSGIGNYCGLRSGAVCTSNTTCTAHAPFDFCTNYSDGGPNNCVRLCPY
jgi:hypothetical protein